MKTIIVPIDLSDESLNGLNLSLMLATKTGANILMVHHQMINKAYQRRTHGGEAVGVYFDYSKHRRLPNMYPASVNQVYTYIASPR
jgi:hypothetical protein